MAPTPSVRIIKDFTYKGTTQRWSNRYHFNGGVPADNTAWNTLFDAIVDAEKSAIGSDSEIVEAVGYLAGATVAAHSKTYITPGEFTGGEGSRAPGDCAALVRYPTAARTSKNHPIYLFNYYHDVTIDIGDRDAVSSAYISALEDYADLWLAGFSDGTHTCVRAGPNGADATARAVNPFITHRDFPR